MQCIQSVLNDSSRKPISHITTCRQNADEEEPRYLAVNSYDNVLRVYDRGLDPPKSNMRLMHSLVGHKNKNWPIKSAFYQGPLVPRLKRDGQYGSEGLDELHDHHSHREFRGSASGNRRQIENRYLLLATGSADPYALVYSVGVTQSAASAGASVGQSGMTNWTASNTAIDDSTTDVDVNSPAGPLSPNASSVSDGLEHHQQQQFTSDIVQRIEGHADRVYAVSFHPTDILMATCSADSTIKVWKGKSSL